MNVELNPDEVALLHRLLQDAERGHRERLREGAGAEHGRLADEWKLLDGLRGKLRDPRRDEKHREAVVDHAVEESFPASDPPAHSVVKEEPPAAS